MVYLKTETYLSGKPILFGQTASRTPFSVALKATDILPDANGKKYVPEGSFIADINGEIRILPRALAVSAVSTASPSFTVKSPSMGFKVGDTLFGFFSATLIFIGTPLVGDIVLIRLNNTTYSVTADATTTTALLAKIEALDDAVNTFSTLTGSRISVSSAQSSSISVSVIPSSSSSTLNAVVNSSYPGYLGFNSRPLGSIQSIGTPNAAGERVITLAANASLSIPAGQVVGVVPDKLIGIYPDPLDFTSEPVKHIAPIYHADGVYEKNLPYCDAAIKRELHGLNINKKFYANA